MPLFIDERISIHSNNSSQSDLIESPPVLIGDIGLQTGLVANTPDAANVRVALEGTLNVNVNAEIFPTITITIERNSTGVAGTGVLIYTEVVSTLGASTFAPISITAGDFPPAVDVNANQIRYSLFITSTIELFLNGPVAFNGSAVA